MAVAKLARAGWCNLLAINQKAESTFHQVRSVMVFRVRISPDPEIPPLRREKLDGLFSHEFHKRWRFVELNWFRFRPRAPWLSARRLVFGTRRLRGSRLFAGGESEKAKHL